MIFNRILSVALFLVLVVGFIPTTHSLDVNKVKPKPNIDLPIVESSRQEASTNKSEDENFGKKMIEFIRKLLGDEPKPIDEKLIRDEM